MRLHVSKKIMDEFERVERERKRKQAAQLCTCDRMPRGRRCAWCTEQDARIEKDRLAKQKLSAVFSVILPIVLWLAIVLGILLPTRSCQRDPLRTVYKQDPRTGVCFAYTWLNSATAVPCTNRVKELLEK